jgi:light-regulated signal transduction histidine kinase (bacteriophytochrome)
MDLSVSEINSNGEILYSGIVRDITERKRAEQDNQKLIEQLVLSNTELERFAYICSHDLQEPLRMVSNFTQRLRDHLGAALDEKAQHYMSYVIDGALRARQLITDILAYARIGSSQEMEREEIVDTQEVFNNALKDLSERIADTRGRVTHGALPKVRAHPIHVRQLIQNLIGNALKFHGKVPPAVRVDAEYKKGMWEFSVTDNGIGIPAEYQHKLFQIFQRLHSREDYPGNGIGLAICKKIVQQYGGNIWLKSKTGEGTTFYFTLPAEAGSKSGDKSKPASLA